MRSPRNSSIETMLTITMIVLVLGICADLLFRFSLQNPTLLGDPYYRTDILANQRAPLALLFSWFVVLLGFILGIIKYRSK